MMSVSPSLLGAFFERGRCDRFLGFRVAKKAEAPTTTTTAVGAAHIAEGLRWETRLLARLKNEAAAGKSIRVVEGPPSAQSRVSEEATIRELKKANGEEIEEEVLLYQPTLTAPARFYADLGVDASRLRVSTCYPDFLLLRPRCKEVVVVDAKGSRAVKLAHRVQVATYAMLVESILRENGVTGDASVSVSGAVWLRDAATFETFDLSVPRTLVATTLRRLSSSMAEVPAVEDLPWRLDASACTDCQFAELCELQATRERRLSLVHGISEADEEFLREALPDAEGPRFLCIEGTLARLRDSQLQERLSLDGREKAARILGLVESFVSGEPRTCESGSTSFPLHADDVGVFLTIVQDAPSLKYCGWSLHIVSSSKKSEKVRQDILARLEALHGDSSVNASEDGKVVSVTCATRTAPKDADTTAVLAQLVLSLHTVLDAVDQHNRIVSWQHHVSARLYLFDSLDAALLETALWRMSDSTALDMDVLEKLSRLSISAGDDLPARSQQGIVSMAQKLLCTFFSSKGSAINAPVVPDITKLSKPRITLVQREVDRLLALGLRTLRISRSDYLHSLQPRVFAATAATLLGRRIGARLLLDLWYDFVDACPNIAGVHRAASGALSADAKNLSTIVASVRKILSKSPQASRILQYSGAFFWVLPLSFPHVDSGGRETEGLSLTRRQCAFLTAHELFLQAERRRALHASQSISAHIKRGNYFLLERNAPPPGEAPAAAEPVDAAPSSTPKRKTRAKKKEKRPALFSVLCVSQDTQRLSEAEFGWWLVPFEGTPECDARIEKTLTGLSEFRDTFANRLWATPEGWARAMVGSVSKDGKTVELKGPKLPDAGERFILIPATVDFSSPYLFQQLLKQPDEPAEDEVTLESLLESPTAWGNAPFSEEASRVTAHALSVLGARESPLARLTPSQVDAIRGALSHHLQLIHGPPGTGKTRSLAALSLLLISAHRAVAARPHFRVLVIALANSNIRHILHTISDMRSEFGLSDVKVGRLDAESHKAEDFGNGGESVTPGSFLKHNPCCVIGSTVWQLRHAFDLDGGSDQFDLVIWDDASQSRAAELAFPVALIPASRGRLVVAGDPIQLPPIISGDYRSSSSSSPPRTTLSLFSCLAAGDPSHTLVSVLTENWRMNSGLCGFLARTLYSQESCKATRQYQPATEGVSSSCLSIAQGSAPLTENETFILTPSRALVVVLLKPLQQLFAVRECLEADFVVALAKKLRALLPAKDNAAFWSNSLIVLTPHHFQRLALLSSLNDEDAAVETVERAQGSERDCAIADYALFDPARLAQEADFVLNVNRINVCISRARHKCIFLVSEPLLQIDPEVICASASRQAGLRLLQTLVSHARDTGAFIEIAF